MTDNDATFTLEELDELIDKIKGVKQGFEDALAIALGLKVNHD